jgi:hypothetical protein
MSVLVVLAAVAVAGCGAEIRDLEGVSIEDPEKAEIYSNVDEHPNVVRLCIDGEVVVTTTRDGQSALQFAPQGWWEEWCPGGTGSRAG